MDEKNSDHSQTVWLPVCCCYPLLRIGGLTVACFHFFITKIAPSKNALHLLALTLDFVFSSFHLNSHKQKDNETKMLDIFSR